MQRLLIAEEAKVYAPRIVKALADEFIIEVCRDGSSALEKLCTFDPDILVLDTVLPGIDSFTVLHTLRASGHSAAVIVLSDLTDPLTIKRLDALKVSDILPKPCAVNMVISHIKDLSFYLRYPNMEDLCLENEVDRILLSLGFEIGPSRYKAIYHAIIYRYEHPGSSYMKEVCPAVVKRIGGNWQQVEKAIRDAIRHAFDNGNAYLWQMYFPAGKEGECTRPGADDFVARIARCLIQRERIKLPYIPQRKIAK